MLVVDPTPGGRRVLRAHLFVEFDVRTAKSTGGAKAMLRRRLYDVVLLAVRFPVETIMRFVAVVERDYPTTAILFVTDRDVLPLEAPSAETIAQPPPFETNLLLPRIRSSLASMRARRAEAVAIAGGNGALASLGRRRMTPRPR